MTDKKHALYLIDPDGGKPELIHADDVADKKAAGWKEPEGLRANGAAWNVEEDLPGQDAAAEFAKAKAEADAKKAAAEAKEAAKADSDDKPKGKK